MADRITVGNAEIVFALDMVPPPRASDAFFEGVTADDWGPYQDILEDGQIQLYYGHFFVRSGGKTVMVDTGMGPGPHPERGNRTGDLLNQLKLHGASPEDIDIVVHTHLHADHVGWNLDLSGDTPKPYFPKARYLVPRMDWEHFTRPDVLASAPHVKDNVVPLEGLGLMELVDEGHNVTDGLTTLATPGHTPGHQVILISSQGEKAMIVGDAIHSKVQVQEPDWCAGVDTNKDDSRRSRHALLERAENEGYVIAAGHFHPHDHIGKIITMEGRRFWQVL
jgi:glyoxylase-like metal-dependent hydrolase (beta-lactamase superfamily II)